VRHFFEEIVKRKVLPVAAAYAIGGWLLLQIGDVLIGLLELPGWTGKVLVAVVALGLPVALVLSWLYDWTPQGIVSAAGVDTSAPKRYAFAELGTIDIGQLDLGRPQLTPLIGRAAECETIATRLDEAAAGRGGVVLIGGEPGVGKTRLGEEALELGLERQMLPLVGHAYEEHAAPFIISTEILEDIVRALPPDTLRSALGDTAPEISRLLPGLRRVLPDIPEPLEVPPDQQQRYLFNALLDFIERLSGSAPLVMLLDDLQWADDSSTLLLEHFVPHLPRMPVLFVVTYRDVAADMGEPFKRALGMLSRQEFATRIPLRQLSRDDVMALLTNLGGAGVPDELVDVIYQETSGNAFFVKSVYQHLAEEGRLFDAAGNWLTDIDVAALAVPEGVRLVIERRVQRLGEQTARTLTLASVMGLRFDLGVLEEMHDDAAGDVLDAIEEAETAGLVFAAAVHRENRYEFSHALVRHALLDALSPPRRQRFHLQLAQAMEAVYGDSGPRVADIARHYYRAGPSADADKTRHFLELAGLQALATAAADEARIAFDGALELVADDDVGQRAMLLYRRGLAWRTLGRWDASGRDWDDALEGLEATGHNDIVTRICWERAFQSTWALDPPRAQAFAERGLRAAGDEPSAARCRLLAVLGHAVGLGGEFDESDAYLAQATAMAEALGDPHLLGAEVLMSRQYNLQHYHRGALHAEVADRAIALVREHGKPWDVSVALSAATPGYLATGRFKDLERFNEEALSLAVQHGDLGGQLHAHCFLALVHAYRGELDTARELMLPALDIERELPAYSFIQSILAAIHLWRGEWEPAKEAAAQAVAHAVSGAFEGLEAAHQLKVLAGIGDADAEKVLETWRWRWPQAGQQNPAGAWYLGMAAIEAAALLGRRGDAAALYPCAVQLSELGSLYSFSIGLTERFAGIAAAAGGNWEQAEQHFDNAIEQAQQVNARLELTETVRWRAQMLLWRDEPDDREQARQLLTKARSAYAEIGMSGHVGIVEKMLAASEEPGGH